MLLHDSRRDARFDGQDLVLLPDQDRSRWDGGQIAEGRALLGRALASAPAAGPYVIQAAIAALQAEAELDWPQIAVLYSRLAEQTGFPGGPAEPRGRGGRSRRPGRGAGHRGGTRPAGLPVLALDPGRAAAAAGPAEEARAAYQRALDLARTAPERRFLAERAAGLDSGRLLPAGHYCDDSRHAGTRRRQGHRRYAK